MRTALRMLSRPCVLVCIVALCLVAAVGPGRAADFDGEWLAIEKCGASKFNPKAFPAYSAPVVLTVRNGKASGRRQIAMRPGFEDLTGEPRRSGSRCSARPAARSSRGSQVSPIAGTFYFAGPPLAH
jgi:hypothetical protein